MTVRSLGRTLAALLALLPAATGARAQLRPLDPLEWRVWDGSGRTLVAAAGGSVLYGQRAALAGTEGRLVELGNWELAWRSGRVAVEAGGTVQRLLREDRAFTPPAQYVRPAPGGRRHDSGDYRIATVVRLTPERAPGMLMLRFGARLPTTDNTTGLDRDATDFFALLAGRVRRGALAVSGESGVSINGTREPTFEQSDVWAFSLRTEYHAGRVAPMVEVVGQMDGLPGRSIRGNEDLAELRLGARAGERRFVEVALVRGIQAFSPSGGVLVRAGITR